VTMVCAPARVVDGDFEGARQHTLDRSELDRRLPFRLRLTRIKSSAIKFSPSWTLAQTRMLRRLARHRFARRLLDGEGIVLVDQAVSIHSRRAEQQAKSVREKPRPDPAAILMRPRGLAGAT